MIRNGRNRSRRDPKRQARTVTWTVPCFLATRPSARRSPNAGKRLKRHADFHSHRRTSRSSLSRDATLPLVPAEFHRPIWPSPAYCNREASSQRWRSRPRNRRESAASMSCAMGRTVSPMGLSRPAIRSPILNTIMILRSDQKSSIHQDLRRNFKTDRSARRRSGGANVLVPLRPAIRVRFM